MTENTKPTAKRATTQRRGNAGNQEVTGVSTKPFEMVAPTAKPEAAKVDTQTNADLAAEVVAKAKAPKDVTGASVVADPPKPTEVKVKTKVEVTPADLARLDYVAKHHKKPVTRHLDKHADGWVCPHFDQPKYQHFRRATEEELETLKPCMDCSYRAARERVGAEK